MIDTLQHLRELGKSLVIVTHHPDEVPAPSTRFILDEGRLHPFDEGPTVRSPKSSEQALEPETQKQVLNLSVLGSITADLAASPLKLTPRLAELLTLLAQNPQGLTGEQLLLKVYGESGKLGTLKTAISRLRELVPIASQPYRIDEPVSSDLTLLQSQLLKGDLDSAVDLYRGPLLPESSAPGVIDLREHLEESLRQAAMASPSVTAAFQLAETIADDLELWENARAKLPAGDPRHAVSVANVLRLKRSWA